MSAQTQPITAARFAAALPDLPLSSLHAKAAEIQNSIAHLKQSVTQLKPHADEGDIDCREAIEENQVVIERQLERVNLLKQEVERRGFLWGETDMVNGTSDADMVTRVVPEEHQREQRGDPHRNTAPETHQGGRLGDDELAIRLAERMAEDDDGVHL